MHYLAAPTTLWRTRVPDAGLIDGRELAAAMVDDAAKQAAAFGAATGRKLCLATVLVGEDPGSVTYVRMKQNRCAQAGMSSRHVPLPAQTTTAELVEIIAGLSHDRGVDGILLQHPVPPPHR